MVEARRMQVALILRRALLRDNAWLGMGWKPVSGAFTRECVRPAQVEQWIGSRNGHGCVYLPIGVRDKPDNKEPGVCECNLLIGDIDAYEGRGGVAALKRLPFPPAMITQTSLHGWQIALLLEEPVTPADWSTWQRRLQVTLGGCDGIKNAAGLWRAAGTLNVKKKHLDAGEDPFLVQALQWNVRSALTLDQVDEALNPLPADDQPARKPAPPVHVHFNHDDPIETMTPDQYFPGIAGINVTAGEVVNCPCPDHPDTEPSCRIYSDSWWCYGCHRGPGPYQLSAGMLGYRTGRGELRGRDFSHAKVAAEMALGLRRAA